MVDVSVATMFAEEKGQIEKVGNIFAVRSASEMHARPFSDSKVLVQ